MLIRFSVGNFICFKDIVTLNMAAAPSLKDLEGNAFSTPAGKNRLLKSAVIYGANASGKSTIINAMSFMRYFVIVSSKDTQTGQDIPVKRFLLSEETDGKPSHFEMIFIQGDICYRYGFEVDETRVHKEWLYQTKLNGVRLRETMLFERTDNAFEFGGSLRSAKFLKENTRENSLFVSVSAQFNIAVSKEILNWFKNLIILSGLNDDVYAALKYLKIKATEEDTRDFLGKADIGIEDLIIKKSSLSGSKSLFEGFEKEKMPRGLSYGNIFVDLIDGIQVEVNTLHKKYGNDHRHILSREFTLDVESAGTQKMFYLVPTIVEALRNGRILIVDELDARLHALLTVSIITLFNSAVINDKNAQLIFATHDTNLLSRRHFRKDQIWFTEKDAYGVADLYSLDEFKLEDESNARSDASFEKNYINGRYGAIPYLGDFASLFTDDR